MPTHETSNPRSSVNPPADPDNRTLVVTYPPADPKYLLRLKAPATQSAERKDLFTSREHNNEQAWRPPMQQQISHTFCELDMEVVEAVKAIIGDRLRARFGSRPPRCGRYPAPWLP